MRADVSPRVATTSTITLAKLALVATAGAARPWQSSSEAGARRLAHKSLPASLLVRPRQVVLVFALAATSLVARGWTLFACLIHLAKDLLRWILRLTRELRDRIVWKASSSWMHLPGCRTPQTVRPSSLLLSSSASRTEHRAIAPWHPSRKAREDAAVQLQRLRLS